MMKMMAVSMLLVVVLITSSTGQLVELSPPSVRVVEGNQLTFTCSGLDGPQIIQINNNVTFDRIRANTSEGGSGSEYPDDAIHYQLDSLDRDNNGSTIQCFINGIGSNILTIIIDFPPVYSPSEAVYNIVEGTSGTIELSLDALPLVYTYSWFKDGVPLLSTDRLSLTVNSMTFSSISSTDDGYYTVMANDTLGSATANIRINVYYGPRFTTGIDTVNITVLVGEAVTINCSLFEANPPVTDLRLIYDTAPSANNIAASDGSFTINSASLGDIGTYTCIATNIIATTELSYNVLVGSLPNVTLTLDVTFTNETIIINGIYVDNSIQPVIAFHITINGVTYIVTSFPFELPIDDTFIRGETNTITVVAVNALGNVTVVTSTFTVPGELP
jgi:hypothetical protein